MVALVDSLSLLPDAEGGVIPVSEVHELLLKVYDILDKAVYKQVGNLAYILAYLFNSVSRQHCEVWASQFPFLYSLRDVIPPSEACPYGHINWSLAQAHHQSSVGLSQSFPPKRDGKARPQTGFYFTVQRRPVPGSSGASLAKKPQLECGNEVHPSEKKSAGGSVSTSSAETRRKGSHRGWHSWCARVLSFFSLFIISICSFSGWYAFQIFDQSRSITSNRFLLNMVQGHHLQLRSCPPLFHIILLFRRRLMSFLLREWLNPLLVVLVSVVVCLWFLSILGASGPFLTWSILIIIYIHLKRCLLLDMYGSLSTMVIMLFLLIYSMLIFIFLLLSIMTISYTLFGIMCLISGRSYLLGWPQPLWFLQPSPNLFCSLAIGKVSLLLSVWMTSWS